MAKRKKQNNEVVVSRPLEERWEIDFLLVGYQEWLDLYFSPEVLAKCKVKVVTKPEDIKPYVEWLLKQSKLGVDTETTGADKRSGLDPWREGSRLLLFQIGTGEKVFLFQPELVPYLREVLESKEILHILHNAVYDFKYLLAKYNVHMERMYDTMLAEQMLTAGLPGMTVGLADVVRRYPPHRLISKDVRKEFIHFEEHQVFSWEMLYYAARDIVLMFPVMEEQTKKIQQYKLENVAKLEFRLIPCTSMMELGGTYINQKKHRYAIQYWENKQKELEDKILEIYDEELSKRKEAEITLFGRSSFSFKIKSTAQKRAALAELGFELEDAQVETLEKVDHEMAKLLVEYSAVVKTTSTYGERMLSRINPQTGRLHPKFFQLGAGDASDVGGRNNARTIATGRYASDFQQLPKDIKVFVPVDNQTELDLVVATFKANLQKKAAPIKDYD